MYNHNLLDWTPRIVRNDNFDDAKFERSNRRLERMPAETRVHWALENLPATPILTSSFGIQSAVMLHLVTRIRPEIPVILVDTGYLFAETYRYVDRLTRRLDLNLHVYRADLSPAWQEARHGQLWRQGPVGLETYSRVNRVEPFRRALAEFDAGGWFAGLRRQQSGSRRDLPVLRRQHGRLEIRPIVDWSNGDVRRYLERHDLPYHPLAEAGYASLGDVHSSAPLAAGQAEERARFPGLGRERRLHE